jgi:hypothetical protein
MKLFINDFLIAFALTLVLGGMLLLSALAFLSTPPTMEAKKSERLSVEELQRGN